MVFYFKTVILFLQYLKWITENKWILIGDRFMRETHLRQPEFTYNACGMFTKHCERIKKFKEAGDLKYI